MSRMVLKRSISRLEEAGGAMLFYEMDGSSMIPVEQLQPRHYDPEKRAVGFVAANEALAEIVMEMLMQNL